MKCVLCGSDFRFLDGFLTRAGMICPNCRAAAAAQEAARLPTEALEKAGITVTVQAQVDRALREIYTDPDPAKGEGTLQAAVSSGEEKGAPGRTTALLWRTLLAAARYRTAVRLLDGARAAEAAVPADQRDQFEKGTDLRGQARAVESAGLWFPSTLLDFTSEDEAGHALTLSCPAPTAEVAKWRTWRPYNVDLMSKAEANTLDSKLGWTDVALQRWLREETARSRVVLLRLSLLEAFGRATGQGDEPAALEAAFDRPAAFRFFVELIDEIVGRLGAAAARSAASIAEARRRAEARAAPPA